MHWKPINRPKRNDASTVAGAMQLKNQATNIHSAD